MAAAIESKAQSEYKAPFSDIFDKSEKTPGCEWFTQRMQWLKPTYWDRGEVAEGPYTFNVDLLNTILEEKFSDERAIRRMTTLQQVIEMSSSLRSFGRTFALELLVERSISQIPSALLTDAIEAAYPAGKDEKGRYVVDAVECIGISILRGIYRGKRDDLAAKIPEIANGNLQKTIAKLSAV